MNDQVRNLMSLKSPLANNIRRHFVFEGDKLGVKRFDGSTSVSEMRTFEASSLITREEAPSTGISKAVDQLSTQLADAQSKAILETINEAVDAAGNTVDGQGKPFSPELFLQAIDKILIDFEGDKPKLPTFYCGPNSVDRFNEVIDRAMTTEPYKSQYESIMVRKKREFDEREASRKLVD